MIHIAITPIKVTQPMKDTCFLLNGNSGTRFERLGNMQALSLMRLPRVPSNASVTSLSWEGERHVQMNLTVN